jgi:hypothetical protein
VRALRAIQPTFDWKGTVYARAADAGAHRMLK